MRVRRGLGTADESEAKSLVDEYNALLADENYWKLSAKERAAKQFDPRVVSGFYDQIESKAETDPWATRENALPLPGKADGLARVLFVGATGAGKTTLLRRLIGTDPLNERFPSTSTAKTTTFDTEIILSPGPYRCVISFYPQDRIRANVEECVAAAVTAAAENRRKEEVARALLEHSEQRFRLYYMLGQYPTDEEVVELTDEFDDENAVEKIGDVSEPPLITPPERVAMNEKLRRFVDDAISIGIRLRDEIAASLGVEPGKLTDVDRDTLMELVEYKLSEEEDQQAQLLVDALMDEIESRFSSFSKGTLSPDGNDWPETWQYATEDRTDFIQTVNRFSSNYAPNFGKLLAPLVQGLRVAAPFEPDVLEVGQSIPQLAFLDGEGLGHVTATASSLPTSLTRRYSDADVILLIDNAEQPAQASLQSVLRSVAASGNESKLAIAFTHFDQVKGVNFADQASKRNHVMASLNQALDAVEDAVGAGAGRRLKRRLDGRVVFLSRINEPIDSRMKATNKSLADLLNICLKSIEPIQRPRAVPVYDLANLVLAVRSASSSFQEFWNARLGMSFKPGIPKEHWARVKALSRRFAFQWGDEYEDLRPVADIIRMLTERVAAFIATPREWKPAYPSEEEMEGAVDLVAQEFYRQLHDAMRSRLTSEHLHEWASAYAYRGSGSTRLRARDIRGIYEAAAPIPDEAPSRYASELLDTIRSLFVEAAESAGAAVIGSTANA